jgi:NAD(P)-dependent dehydrogenase (short-subunit alcohol dehydrogenase family)
MSSSRTIDPPLNVVITGATSGVGRATARMFAGREANVALLARGQDALRATADEIAELGGVGLPIPTDVSSAEEVDRAAAKAVEDFGGIDIWVNNAMTTVFSFFSDISPEEFERATEVTYLGVVWGTRAALRHMMSRNEGTIVQVGSALAYRGIPLQSAYCGAKHAINGFTDSIRTELIHHGSDVHVGMVNLPALNTPQFSHCRSRFQRHPMPVPPLYQPEVAAEAIDLLCTQRRRVVNVGYPTLFTVAANKIAPGLLDRYLGSSGVDSQLSDMPPSPHNREGNLMEPVPGDPGAAGVFDDDAKPSSPWLWLDRNRLPLGGLAAAAASLIWLARR